MIKSNCEYCGTEIIRGGQRAGRFCSLRCKGEWQKTQKPVNEAWLRQKYLVEGLSTYGIAKLVGRNPKQVYEWLVGYGIPTRQRGWDITPSGEPRRSNRPPKPHQNKEWLEREYVERQRSASDIAQECTCTEANILQHLRKFGIPRRNMSTIRKSKHWGLRGKANGMSGRTGETNPNYTDGSSPERQRLYASGEWKEIVRTVYKRDNYHCVRCGSPHTGTRSLCAHHIKPWAGNPSLRFDLDNLITLCRVCHHWVHSRENVSREYIE